MTSTPLSKVVVIPSYMQCKGANEAPPQFFSHDRAGDEAKIKKLDESSDPKSAVQRLRVTIPSGLTMRRAGGRKQETIPFRLPYITSFTTAAGAPYNVVIPMQPSAASEWSALSALYDEVIIDRIRVRWIDATETTYTTQTPQIWVFAYDPIDNSAISSLTNGLQHSQNYCWGKSVNQVSQDPMSQTSSGLHTWDITVPRGTARSATNTAVFGHEWSSLGDPNDFYGFIKPYLNVLGNTGTTTFVVYIEYYGRFRSRT